MTYEQKLTALAGVIPTEAIELLKAYRFATDARQYLSDQYDKAFNNAEEDCMNPHFIADGGTKHIEAIADNVWKRACNALHDWLYDDYEDMNRKPDSF